LHYQPDDALVAILHALERSAYRFITVTPATHKSMLRRYEAEEARTLRDVFGWSLPFRAPTISTELLDLLRRADAVEEVGALMKSRLRVASIGSRLFLHSAFPTEDDHSVFFGPDTYRFAAFIAAELPRLGPVRRIVDIGAGSGAGGIIAAGLAPGARVTFTDVNPEALHLAGANASHAGVEPEMVHGEDLNEVTGPVDLILANPPYMMDESDRAYRNGGGMHGAAVSLDWALSGARRLEPGGHMLLYTGVAIVDGRDALREALERQLPTLQCVFDYREIDPDIFGEELEKPSYLGVERIAAIGAVIVRR
jgi:methylase of polypeptide subunit release factors